MVHHQKDTKNISSTDGTSSERIASPPSRPPHWHTLLPSVSDTFGLIASILGTLGLIPSILGTLGLLPSILGTLGLLPPPF